MRSGQPEPGAPGAASGEGEGSPGTSWTAASSSPCIHPPPPGQRPVSVLHDGGDAVLTGGVWWASARPVTRGPSPSGVTVSILPPTLVFRKRRQGAVLSLQDLGVTKVGHMKRILCGIKELSRSTPATEA